MATRHERRSRILATIIIVIVLILIWDPTAAVRGRLKAKFDFARGHYAILAYGLPPGGSDEYTQLLKERYGIERRQIALCIVGSSTIAYADSYNRVSVAAAQKKARQDIFEQTWQDAQRAWLHKHLQRERIVGYLFAYLGETPDAHDPVCLRSLTPGMPMKEVVEKCGRPDEDVGSDKYEFVYRMPDGASVTISARSLLSTEQITYKSQQHLTN